MSNSRTAFKGAILPKLSSQLTIIKLKKAKPKEKTYFISGPGLIGIKNQGSKSVTNFQKSFYQRECKHKNYNLVNEK